MLHLRKVGHLTPPNPSYFLKKENKSRIYCPYFLCIFDIPTYELNLVICKKTNQGGIFTDFFIILHLQWKQKDLLAKKEGRHQHQGTILTKLNLGEKFLMKC